MNQEFYKDKNILITGAEGFIGSNLSKELVKRGAKITALVHSNDIKNLYPIKDKIKIIIGDLNENESINKISGTNAEYIFHLAALVKPNLEGKAEEVLENNLKSTINIAKAAIKMKNLKRLIFSSTCQIYGDSDKPKKEDHEINLKSMYSISKYVCEEILKSYQKEEGLPLTIIRLSNIYGQNKKDNVIYFFIKASLENKGLIINGNGKQARDFVHIEDAIEAFLIVTREDKLINKTINLGSRNQINIQDLAKKIKEMSKSSSDIIYQNNDPGLRNIICDNDLLRSYGWEQKVDFDSGLKKTIEWMKKNENII